ncbi:MAG: FG-GAP repeat domain-containing protein [Polyangiaceae bacterium]
MNRSLLAVTALAAVAGCGGSASRIASGDAATADVTFPPSPDGGAGPEAGPGDALAPDGAAHSYPCLPHAHSCTFKGFAPAVSYVPANEPLALVAIDRTCTGHLDLVVGERTSTGWTTELFANTGNGAFVASSPYGAGGNDARNMVAADFNGDGRVDLASQSNGQQFMDIGADGGAIGIDLGKANSSFASESVLYPTRETTGYLAAGDFNGDGHPDLAFAGYDYFETVGGPVGDSGLISTPGPEPTDFSLDVYLNAGDGTFAAPVAYPNPDWFQNIATGDFDGDGHLDIAETTSSSEGGFGVFFNAGDGTFRSEATFVASTSWIAYGLGVADFNGDGKDDVATTTILNTNQPNEAIVLAVFTGAGNGTFDGPAMYPIADVPSVYQVVTGDFNGDGKPDLAIVMGLSPTSGPIEPTPVSVFENTGDGTFGAPVVYTVAGEDKSAATAIVAGDFNGDGVTDIAVTTEGQEDPYPLAVNVLLSECE